MAGDKHIPLSCAKYESHSLWAQVRVPVGYWLFAQRASDAPPFVPGASTYLDAVFKWGAQYGIGVLVDMHAAPSSQNGCVRGKSSAQRHAKPVHRACGVQICRPLCMRQLTSDKRKHPPTQRCCWLACLCLLCTAYLHHNFLHSRQRWQRMSECGTLCAGMSTAHRFESRRLGRRMRPPSPRRSPSSRQLRRNTAARMPCSALACSTSRRCRSSPQDFHIPCHSSQLTATFCRDMTWRKRAAGDVLTQTERCRKRRCCRARCWSSTTWTRTTPCGSIHPTASLSSRRGSGRRTVWSGTRSCLRRRTPRPCRTFTGAAGRAACQDGLCSRVTSIIECYHVMDHLGGGLLLPGSCPRRDSQNLSCLNTYQNIHSYVLSAHAHVLRAVVCGTLPDDLRDC